MVTLEDVAVAAGVHPSTVSRSLSRPQMVDPATLDRVRTAVERLGYVPNRAARQLAGGRTASVAVLVPDITNPFFSGVLQEVQRAADADRRLVLLADTNMRARTEVEAAESLAPAVDGMIVCSPIAATAQLRRAAAGRPLVLVNRRARVTASVEIDQGAIVSLALGHLRSLGHRRIAVLLGPATYWSSGERLRRLHDLARAWSDGAAVVHLAGAPPTFDGGRESLDPVLQQGATAVAAFNDVMALGLVSAALERGLQVPGDLSVVGSDGVPIGAMAVPTLTTVAAPMDEVGRLALRLLDDQLAGSPPSSVAVQPRLVARSSSGPPRAVVDG